MTTMTDRIKHAREVLDWAAYVDKDVTRIIDLVQKNQDVFNVVIGGSCVAAAADYLEKIVAERNR